MIGSAVENPVSLVSCVGVRCFTCCFKLESRLPPSPLGFFVHGTEVGFLCGTFGRVFRAFLMVWMLKSSVCAVPRDVGGF